MEITNVDLKLLIKF